MKPFFLINSLFFLCLLSFSAPAQDTTGAGNKEAAYVQVITARAEKIVRSLNLNNAAKESEVRALVIKQYQDLNSVYTERDNAIKALKAGATDKAAMESSKKTLEEAAQLRVDKLHQSYFASLSKHLTAGQVEEVKDAMTYRILPITYKAYQDEIPTLTEKQKAYILATLQEAREHAVDAESAEKKHAWFGKYKGRINNYLSKEGYDMKKEGAAWQERIKAAEAQKK